jgi:hypothetical protein
LNGLGLSAAVKHPNLLTVNFTYQGTSESTDRTAENARCWECSSERELEEATITDTSGGAYLQLCQWCRDVFERRHDIYQPTVCVRCGRHSDPSRADGLRFFDPGDGEALHVCDDCRLEMLGMVGSDTAPLVGVERCRP